MSVHKLTRVQNDSGEPINFTITLDGAVQNLSGCTVDFIEKSPTGVASNAGHTACTITNAALGQCTYTFQVGDLTETGVYTCDLQLTNPATAPFPMIVTEYAQYEITVRAANG